MISDIERAQQTSEVFVPEFGLLDIQYLDAGKKYQGRIYRMSPETMKALSDAIGFTAKFDSPTVRTAYADIFKTAGKAILEIDRNTKPTDVSVRYMRDRWSVSEVASKGADALRPWICTEYTAVFLPEKVFAALAYETKVGSPNIEHFYIRFNFKDKTIGLIGEESRAGEFPGGAFAVVSVPLAGITTVTLAESVVQEEGVYMEMQEQTVVEAEILDTQPETQSADDETITSESTETTTAPESTSAEAEMPVAETETAKVVDAEHTTETGETEKPAGFFREQPKVQPMPQPIPAPAPAPVPVQPAYQPAYQPAQRSFASKAPAEPQIKYAVYSKSEVDQMLKQQTDAVANGLASKINSQQRLLQDLIANQERTFGKLVDKFVTEVETARLKIDGSTKQASDTTKQDLNEFKNQLAKELEQYRAQINKNIIPLGKTIDEKIKALKDTAADRRKEDIKPLIIKIAAVLAILILASDVLMVVNMVKMSELLHLKGQVSILTDKIDKVTTPQAPAQSTAPAQSK